MLLTCLTARYGRRSLHEHQAKALIHMWLGATDGVADADAERLSFVLLVALASALPALEPATVAQGPAVIGVSDGRLYKLVAERGGAFVTVCTALDAVSVTTTDAVVPAGRRPTAGFHDATLRRVWRLAAGDWGAVELVGAMRWPEREWDQAGRRAERFLAAAGLRGAPVRRAGSRA